MNFGGQMGASTVAECMASCERRFWRTYDRRMRNIEDRANRRFFND
jgi:hypothetical protein